MKVINLLIASLVCLISCTGQDKKNKVIRFDDTRTTTWSAGFELVKITSSMDNNIQKAYFYKSASATPAPLIVSLHTWSGTYSQKDELSELCKSEDLNYIHPDFRGANTSAQACCSAQALADIDDAISFAIKNANVDTSRIYVIGVSGGGYATLSSYMNLKHRVRKFSAWASITDLEAWYHESKITGRKNYAENVLQCTGSEGDVNTKVARGKSPLYMKTPLHKEKNTKLEIYAGVYDGLQGSVPITHSINFYNKLLKDLKIKDQSKYVSDAEKLNLLEFRRPLGKYSSIGGRRVFLKKQSGNVSLVIFEGGHEMLPEYALASLLGE